MQNLTVDDVYAAVQARRSTVSKCLEEDIFNSPQAREGESDRDREQVSFLHLDK